MKYLKLSIIILFLSSVTMFSQTTLRDYLKLAAESNPALKAKFNEYLSSAERIEQENAFPEPQVAFGYFISPVETRVGPQQMKFSLSQKFPWFGKLQARADSRAEYAKSIYKEFEELKYILFYNVKRVWYQLYIKERKIDLVKEQLVFYKTLQALINVKFQNGKATMSDLMRVRIKIDYLENRIAELNLDLEPIRTEFNALLNREPSTAITVAQNIVVDELDESGNKLDSVLARNSGLSVLAQQRQTAVSKMHSIEKERYPDISLGLDYTVVGKRTDVPVVSNGQDAFLPKLSLNIPLFNPKYDAQIQEYSYQRDMFDNKIEDYENKLRTEYQEILSKYQNAKRNIVYLEQQISNTKTVLTLLYTEYATSGDKFLDLVLEQEKILIFEYRLEQEKVKTNLAVAKIEMLNSKF